MQNEANHSVLLAIPRGKDATELAQQSKQLQTGFIQYLQQKQAAGIINVPRNNQV